MRLHVNVTDMKAHVKVNVSVHLDGEQFDRAEHYAGVIPVVDASEGERAMEMLGNHIRQVFRSMGVVAHGQPLEKTNGAPSAIQEGVDDRDA